MDQRRLVKQQARRRMFLFFVGLIGLSAVLPPYPGNPRTLAALLIVFAASVAAVVVLAVGWRRRSVEDLRAQNNIILGLVVVIGASLAVHFAFPVFVFTVLLLFNRFV